MSHHIIEAKNLYCRYPDGHQALEDVSFRIEHGEAVAVIGANGAGKSTLMHHLNGTLVPTSGSVRVGDVPVLPSTLRDVRRTVGMVFQDADDQLFMPTVGEDVAFGPANMGLPPEDVERRVHEALETVGALHLRERPPYRLSGGEKRMVSIATVLAMQPDILVMDEPTNHLDARARRNCIALLQSFKHARIIVSHDLDMVMDVCNRIIVLNQGRLVADDTPKAIFSNAALLEACHLELPLRMQGCPACGRSHAQWLQERIAQTSR
ncbi:MAG: energy-coupling factor ABC transporter ATP-binding protein [Brachymonas sp.]